MATSIGIYLSVAIAAGIIFVGGRFLGRTVTAILALASRGVRSTAVRLPRTVHKNGAGGFAGLLTNIARQSGVSGYPGDGTQRWPAVHALDAAVLFRIALERAKAGTVWHAVADEGDHVRDIASVIGRRLHLPVKPVVGETYGPLAPIFLADQPSSSTYTQRTLGWTPNAPQSAGGPGKHSALTALSGSDVRCSDSDVDGVGYEADLRGAEASDNKPRRTEVWSVANQSAGCPGRLSRRDLR